MRFTIDRINDLRKKYTLTPLQSLWNRNIHRELDILDTAAGINTHFAGRGWTGQVGKRIKAHEDHIEFGLPYFWLGREAEENK